MKQKFFRSMVLAACTLFAFPALAQDKFSDSPLLNNYAFSADNMGVGVINVSSLLAKPGGKDMYNLALTDKNVQYGMKILGDAGIQADKDIQRVIAVIPAAVTKREHLVYAELTRNIENLDTFLKDTGEVRECAALKCVVETRHNVWTAVVAPNRVAVGSEAQIKKLLTGSAKKGKSNSSLVSEFKKVDKSKDIAGAFVLTDKIRAQLKKQDPVYQISTADENGNVVKGDALMAGDIKMGHFTVDFTNGVALVLNAKMENAQSSKSAVNTIQSGILDHAGREMPELAFFIKAISLGASKDVVNLKLTLNNDEFNQLKAMLVAVMPQPKKKAKK